MRIEDLKILTNWGEREGEGGREGGEREREKERGREREREGGKGEDLKT